MQLLHRYQSRCNAVELIRTEEGVFVQKRYPQKAAYLREQRIYACLAGSDLPHAEARPAGERTLLLTPLPGRTLAELLAQQERSGVVEWIVWEETVEWLMKFCRLTGQIMTDPALENFLYDARTMTLYGLDFEACAPGEPTQMATRLAAHIRSSAPEDSPLKREIAEYVLRRFSVECGADWQALLAEAQGQEALLRRHGVGADAPTDGAERP